MAFHLLERDRDAGFRLAASLSAAMEGIGECSRCRMFTDSEICVVCADPSRDVAAVCIVETPADVMAVEQSTPYRGRYFVLMGHLSPLDGIGPAELGLERLETILGREEVTEAILATNPTVEGEATARFIADVCQEKGVRATRIAHGVPVGGELEFVDSGTLAHAFAGRQTIG
jgi:recombination protein RecR